MNIGLTCDPKGSESYEECLARHLGNSYWGLSEEYAEHREFHLGDRVFFHVNKHSVTMGKGVVADSIIHHQPEGAPPGFSSYLPLKNVELIEPIKTMERARHLGIDFKSSWDINFYLFSPHSKLSDQEFNILTAEQSPQQ